MENQYRPLVSIVIPVYKAEDILVSVSKVYKIKHIVIYKSY